jgi:hypothetical protein
LKVYTDTCPGCVCYYPDFSIYEYIGGTWVLEGTYDLPNVKGITEYLYKTFDSSQIKVQSQSYNCFYLKIHGETTYTCGDGFCEADEVGTCYDDCGKLVIYTPTPEVTVGEEATFQVVHSVDKEPLVKVTNPNGIIKSPTIVTTSTQDSEVLKTYSILMDLEGSYTIQASFEVVGPADTNVATDSINANEEIEQDFCGDGVCGLTEDSSTCPDDCEVESAKYCGDGICSYDETICWQDCGYVDIYTTKKSAYVDEKVEFRINHTKGITEITVFGPDSNEVAFNSLYTSTACATDFCLDKYYFKPAKTGTYTVNVELTLNNNTVMDSDYTEISERPSDPDWILLASGEHVDSGHYLCGEINLDYQSIVKIKGVFRNTNDYYARYLLDCVDCDDILNTWALTTSAGASLYGTESRCETEKTSGEFCIMGCCSEGTYIKSHNISAGTHKLCIWPTCPDKYYDVDRIWEADLYYNISLEYVPGAVYSPTQSNVTVNVTDPYCGDGVHDPGENHNNCCVDVGCPAHQYCSESNECVKENLPPGISPADEPESYCGDGVHDPSETKSNCCVDVGCPAHQYCSESLNKCVKKVEDIEPTKLLTVALNIEVMRVKLDRLKGDVESIYMYYDGKGETSKASKWSEILDEFESAIEGLTLMAQKLGEDPTESTLEETRRSMQNFKLNLRNIAVKILEVY